MEISLFAGKGNLRATCGRGTKKCDMMRSGRREAKLWGEALGEAWSEALSEAVSEALSEALGEALGDP